MNRHLIPGALLLAAALAAPGAAGAAELKIGYINFGRLLEESPQAKSAQQYMCALDILPSDLKEAIE